MFATWLLEGRIGTLLRREATGDRAAYAIVANVLIGTVLGMSVLRFLIREGCASRSAAGFGAATPSPWRAGLALTTGLGLWILLGDAAHDPILLLNLFAQVLVVSTAEVVVCWAVIGTTLATLLRPHGVILSGVGSALASGLLFGVYHLAHSGPFDSVETIALLTGVGLLTSAFFLMSRDIYATIVFHNFLGAHGVLGVLQGSGRLEGLATLSAPLLVLAVASIAALSICDHLLLRRLSAGTNRRRTSRPRGA